MVEAGKELQTEVWGVGSDVQAWEISIPRARLMQAKTPDVEQNPRSIFQGEIRSSLDGSLLGSDTQPFEVVIFGRVTQWGVYRVVGKEKLEWVRYEPLTVANANADKAFTENGQSLVRKHIDRYYAINTQEVGSLPYEIVMKGMSFLTSRSLKAKFLGLSHAGKSSLDVVVAISSKLMEFNGNSNWGFVFSVSRESTAEEKALATQYAKSLTKIAQVAVGASEESATKAPLDDDEDTF